MKPKNYNEDTCLEAASAKLDPRPRNEIEELQQVNSKLKQEIVEQQRELLGLYRRLI